MFKLILPVIIQSLPMGSIHSIPSDQGEYSRAVESGHLWASKFFRFFFVSKNNFLLEFASITGDLIKMNKDDNSFAVVEQNFKAATELALGGILNLFVDGIAQARAMTLQNFFGADLSTLTIEQFLMSCLWR